MDAIKNIHIGNNIRKLRLLRGMKQVVLAREMGVTQQNISKMEKKNEISDEQIEYVGKIVIVKYVGFTDIVSPF